MPVRSLASSVLRWPDRDEVDRAIRAWAADLAAAHASVTRVGYFGSYARGDWGVGSDVDLLVVVGRSPDSFPRRAAAFDATRLPVPADLLVYTEEEWKSMRGRGGFAAAAEAEAVWVFERVPRGAR